MKHILSKLVFVLLSTFILFLTSCDENISPDSDISLGIYPNPMSERGTFRFELNESSMVTIMIADDSDHEVYNLLFGYLAAGSHQVLMDLGSMNSGIYYCIFKINNDTYIRKFAIIK